MATRVDVSQSKAELKSLKSQVIKVLVASRVAYVLFEISSDLLFMMSSQTRKLVQETTRPPPATVLTPPTAAATLPKNKPGNEVSFVTWSCISVVVCNTVSSCGPGFAMNIIF